MSKKNRWDNIADDTKEVKDLASKEVVDKENKEESVAEKTADPVVEAQEEVSDSLIAKTEAEPAKKDEELKHVSVPPVVAFDPAPAGDSTATSVVKINKKEENKMSGLKKVFVKGQLVRLANAKVYTTSKTSAVKTVANGNYYIADGIQKDGRLRVSTVKSATPRTIVGFVNYTDIK